jgi:hypothetical protein
VYAKVAWAGVAVNPLMVNAGPGSYIPVKLTTRAFGVSCCMEPPVAAKDPNVAFETEKPPPVEIIVSSRLNGPKCVVIGTIEKSPSPAPEVCESRAMNIVDVRSVVRFSVTEKPAKGRDPLSKSACKTVVQILIVASRNKRRVETRRLMVKPPRESLCDSIPNRKLNCLGLYDSEIE